MRIVRLRSRSLLFCLMTLAGARFLAGQSTAARVMGTVTDPTGALIQGVAVAATNPATGWKINATSNAEGQYVLYPLSAGVYDVSFELAGFQSVHVAGLEVYANDEIVRNVRLEVGKVSQEVTVSATASAAILNQSPSTENIVTQDQVETLPLNGRDYNQLVLLGAGAVDFGSTGTNYDLGSVAVNGNRAYSNQYTVDGVPNNFTWQNVSAIGVSVALIQEFKVISGVAPAEYGQGGTNVTVISKGGTNQFHGNLFEYYRGNTFITRNPFSTTAPPPFDRHQFGGSVGGPVRLPHYDGHNRTFFFFNYEGLRQSGGATRVATLPLDAFWKGDFSSVVSRVKLKDPLTPGNPVFPGNIIPASRLNPVALALRPVFPTPAGTGLANNSAINVSQTSHNDQTTAKIDHLLPRNHIVSARLTYANTGGFTPGDLGTPNYGYSAPVLSENAMLSWTAPLSSTSVNELRVGVSLLSKHNEYSNGDYPNTDTAGMQGFVPVTSTMVPPLPLITFTGVDAFTSLDYWGSPNLGQNLTSINNNVFTLSDVFSQTRGKHQLKAGFDGRRTHMNYLYENNGNGSLTFNGANAARSTGYSFADFMLGLPSSSQQTPLQSKVYLAQPEYAFFVQDDWRVRSNLTLTLGVREEMFFHPDEQDNRLSIFSPDLQGGGMVVACSDGQLPTSAFLPAVVAKLTNTQGNFNFPLACGASIGYDAHRLVNNQLGLWGPRAGVAWDPTGHGKWLVRSGYGIFYSRLPQQYLGLSIGQNPPFASLFNYSETITNGVPSITLGAPYPTGGSANVTPYGIEKNFRMPNNQQWNLTLDRTLGSSTVVSIGYLGNKGTHLFRDVNLNMQRVDPATGKIVRVYQSTFGGAAVNYEMANADSTYHAMQAQLRRRFSHGLAYQANWTWAKGLDDVGQSAGASALDVENLGRDRANSDYVRRHQISSNFTWEMPWLRGGGSAGMRGIASRVLGGWRLSGIWRYTTGRYLTAIYTNTAAFSANNRPDVVYGVSPNLPRDQRTASHWFNPGAFAIPPATDPVTGMPRYGNAGRNIVVGPGLNNMDGSLSKIFPIRSERRRVVFRMDMFNIMNHPNWANPDMNISNVNTVSTISNINGTMRQAQFAVEFQY